MASPALPVAGAVLAGGASRRMGTDKALLEVDGRPLVATTCAALRDAGAEPVVVVGGDPHAADVAGVEQVPDRWPGEGPLGGILTALGHLDGDGTRHVAVLACDLPDASSRTVATLLGHVRSSPESVVVPVLEGVPQWLHAVWPPNARRVLLDSFEEGERAPWRAGRRLSVLEVPGLESSSLRDVDRPEDLGGRAAGGRTSRPD